MPANPGQLIMKLLQAKGGELTAREAVMGAALLGIRDNSARVALVRLAAKGLIEAAGRGAYRLGPKATAFAAEVALWRTAERRVTDWDGGWIAVHTAGLGRSDRVALRARSRAFALLGLRELERELWLRPDNLVGGVETIRKRLHSLGLDPDAAVFRLMGLDADREKRARALWNTKALNKHYRTAHRRLEAWLASADKLETDVAARESFLHGDEAIRSLVFDPLLPAPLVDVEARRAYVDCVLRYDRAGHAIWRKVHA